MSNNKVREKLELTRDEALEAISGDLEGFELVSENIVSQSRWSTRYKVVIQRLSDGKFFSDKFSRGSTEYQDESPWEYDKPNFTEVFSVEKTVIVYE